MKTIPKPDELLALHDITAELFAMLREWFEVPDDVTIDLATIDSAIAELGDPHLIAAMAMRKLQALRLISTPGVKTSTDVVVAIVQDLDRALLQAPAMRLKVAAADTDWDAALADLSHGMNEDAPDSPLEIDEDAVHFRRLHKRLHDAVIAVLQASEGQIREMI